MDPRANEKKMEEEGLTIEMERKPPNVGRRFKQKNTHTETTTFVIQE